MIGRELDKREAARLKRVKDKLDKIDEKERERIERVINRLNNVNVITEKMIYRGKNMIKTMEGKTYKVSRDDWFKYNIGDKYEV